MLHPNASLAFVNNVIGHGVIALERIPKGTITWVQDELDQVFNRRALGRLGPLYAPILDKYGWTNRDGDRVLCWDFGRYMNHSCEANTFSPGLEIEIAVRDIEPGEELTSDYAALNLDEPFACACGSTQCRGVIRPGDFETYADRWDALARAAFPFVSQVPQPLWPWVTERNAIEEGLRDIWTLPSILTHRYPAAAAKTRPSRRRGLRTPQGEILPAKA